MHLPAYNARYNKTAEGKRALPFDDESFDLIFLNSVFSHMMTDDVQFYLKEFERVLSKDGAVYATAFIEEDVPEVEENPKGYLGKSTGALHRVRFEKRFFFGLVEQSGLKVDRFLHQVFERTKQSVVILKY